MENSKEKSTVSKLGKLFKESLDNLKFRSVSGNSVSCMTTGFKNLDDIIGGWEPGELIILGARPGMGKTALILSMLREIALKSDQHTGLISLETSKDFLLEKIISIESGIPIISMRRAKFSKSDWEKMGNAFVESMHRHIYIVENPEDDLDSIISAIRDLSENSGIRLVFLDYLQLIDGYQKKHNREQEISSAIRTFKKLANELNIAIIIASQLNRSVELRSGSKRPILADLRDSGAIEEDSDKVIFIHRPEVYGLDIDEEGNSLKGLAEIIVAKNRSGPCGWTMINFDGKFGRFYEVITDPKAYGDISINDLPDDIPPF
jgi:replicative DNA helicase